MFFFMDNSEFRSPWRGIKLLLNGKVISREIDYFVLGGYLVSSNEMRIIEDRMVEVKNKYNIPVDLPIKWNLKDLKEFYKKRNKLDIYKNIMDKSDEIRLSIVSIFKDTECKLIIATKPAYGKDYRKNVYNWAFIDVLQRLGNIVQYELQNDIYPTISIIMDWPDSSDRSFFEIYSDAYYWGRPNFYCGALKSFNFNINLTTSITTNSPHLQIADICIGITKEFVKWCYKKENEERVRKFFPKLLPFFRRGPDNKIMGYGLIVGEKEDYNFIENKISEIQKENNEITF